MHRVGYLHCCATANDGSISTKARIAIWYLVTRLTRNLHFPCLHVIIDFILQKKKKEKIEIKNESAIWPLGEDDLTRSRWLHFAILHLFKWLQITWDDATSFLKKHSQKAYNHWNFTKIASGLLYHNLENTIRRELYLISKLVFSPGSF